MKFTHGSILAVFFQASVAEVLEGLHWYTRASDVAQAIADNCLDGRYNAAAGIIAALSPNNRWERNVKDAEKLAKVFTSGGNLDEIKVGSYGANKVKAISILNGNDPLDILGGNKVRAFYRCIIGEDAVCVDGHAYSVWLGERVSTSSTPKIGDKLYNQIAEDYRIAAKQIFNIKGEFYTPAQVQAITWITWRNLFFGVTE
jgi:hypothetical protein